MLPAVPLLAPRKSHLGRQERSPTWHGRVVALCQARCHTPSACSIDLPNSSLRQEPNVELGSQPLYRDPG
ncbi:hypothetical protein VULLAG_LOCUS12183 [Vulpes lagopus]